MSDGRNKKIAATLIILAVICGKRRRRQQQRSTWVTPWLANRAVKSAYNNIFTKNAYITVFSQHIIRRNAGLGAVATASMCMEVELCAWVGARVHARACVFVCACLHVCNMLRQGYTRSNN